MYYSRWSWIIYMGVDIMSYSDFDWDKMSPEEKLDALYAPDDNELWYQR
jgi:hypothetical protein